MSKISTLNILKQIGFTEIVNSEPFSYSNLPGFEFDFGNFKLKACELMNRNLAVVFIFSGVNKTDRTISKIWFEVPQNVDSFEQCIAYISFGLGVNFQAEIISEWYYQGKQFKNHLPWEKEMEAYNQKPNAYIDYDYFRLIIRKMIQIATNANNEDIATFSFDGEILRINCSGNILIVHAIGIAWKDVSLNTKSLTFLPKRIKKQNGSIYLWKERIYIDNRVFDYL